MFCKLFYVQILVTVLTTKSFVNANFARKVIPDHLMKRFPLVDPTKKHVPQHNIQPHEFVPPVIDPHKRKTEVDVPREPEHTIHSEDMHPDDHALHEQHHAAAREAHHASIRKRDRMDREERERELKKNGTRPEDVHFDPRDSMPDDPTKIAKPKLAPSKTDLHNMIISVFIREMYNGADDENHDKEHWMQSAVMTLEAHFRDHNINYQEIILHDHDHSYIQVLCNDSEEREHIKHLLIGLQPVLAFFMEGKMIFSKFPTESEKEWFKADREEARREKKKQEKERLKIERLAK